MIDIKVYCKNSNYVGILCRGHAGFGPEGRDILCAGVSALLINLENSLEQFTQEEYFAEAEDGCFHLSLTNRGARGGLLLDSCVFGLMNISEEYGEEFIQISLQEVK